MAAASGAITAVERRSGGSLGRYRLLFPAGKGGMGEVWVAEDPRVGRQVALKTLPGSLSGDAARLDRLEREARAVASLQHPGIVILHALEECDGERFLVFEHIEGETFAELLQGGPLGLDQLLDLGQQVADALGSAHDAGIVHRDIKPANLMVTPEGRAKVLDFGVAAVARGGDDLESLTREGTVPGTLDYMSPEQLRGQKVDPRSDLFSLGVVLFEMAAGESPFRGVAPMERAASILNDAPRPLGVLRPELPMRFCELVARCLHKDPTRRPGDAATVATELRRIAADRSRPADSAPTRGVTWRHALALAFLAALLPVAWFLGSLRMSSDSAAPGGLATEQLAREMLVVLPFDNQGDAAHDYFVAGVTDELRSRLAKLSGIGVISRTSANAYPSGDRTAREIGRELGVDYMIEGSVRWNAAAGGRGDVVIVPQLIRTSTDEVLWSESYARPMEDLFRVQADILAAVARTLSRSGGRQELHPTANLEAYQEYLRGTYLLDSVSGEEGARSALVHLDRALEMDADFALARYRVVEALASDYLFGRDRSSANLARLRREAAQLVESRPDLPESLLAAAQVHYIERDYDLARERLAEARSALPSSPQVLALLAYIDRRRGRWDQATAALEEAIVLDPRSPMLWTQLGHTHAIRRNYAKALQVVSQALEFAPEFRDLRLLEAVANMHFGRLARALEVSLALENDVGADLQVLLLTLGDDLERALAVHAQNDREDQLVGINRRMPRSHIRAEILSALGRGEEAREAWQEARRVLIRRLGDAPEDPRALMGLAEVEAGLGMRDSAIAKAERALELMPFERDVVAAPDYWLGMARVYARLGEPEAALEWVRRVLGQPAYFSLTVLERQPIWAEVRELDAFQELRDS